MTDSKVAAEIPERYVASSVILCQNASTLLCAASRMNFVPIYMSRRVHLKAKIISHHRKAFCVCHCTATKKTRCKCVSESPTMDTDSQEWQNVKRESLQSLILITRLLGYWSSEASRKTLVTLCLNQRNPTEIENWEIIHLCLCKTYDSEPWPDNWVKPDDNMYAK